MPSELPAWVPKLVVLDEYDCLVSGKTKRSEFLPEPPVFLATNEDDALG